MARVPAIVTVALLACGGGSSTTPDAAIVPTGTVAIPLVSLDELSYTGPLRTGGQAQAVIVDTGSTTLAVASTACGNCGVTPLYAPGPSAIDQHATGSETFSGDGWSGEIYQDAVQLGADADVAVNLVAIASQSAFFTPDRFGVIGYEGILGLGPDANLIPDTTSYLTAAFHAGVPQTFAFRLCPTAGTMWLGGVDPTAEATPPVVTPMLAPTTQQLNAYLVNVAKMAIGSGSDIGSSGDYGPVVIDTGSSISFIPTAPLTALTTAIEASPGYLSLFGSGQSLGGSADMGCVTTTSTGTDIDETLPPLHVAFPDTTGSASAYVDLPPSQSYLVYSGGTGIAGESLWCYGFADSAEFVGPDLAISLFGDAVLDAYVAVIDVAHQQVSFAASRGCVEPDAVPRPARPRVRGVPWWKQDPRARVPHAR